MCKDRGRFMMYPPHGGKWEQRITSTFGGPLGLKRGRGSLCHYQYHLKEDHSVLPLGVHDNSHVENT